MCTQHRSKGLFLHQLKRFWPLEKLLYIAYRMSDIQEKQFLYRLRSASLYNRLDSIQDRLLQSLVLVLFQSAQFLSFRLMDSSIAWYSPFSRFSASQVFAACVVCVDSPVMMIIETPFFSMIAQLPSDQILLASAHFDSVKRKIETHRRQFRALRQ